MQPTSPRSPRPKARSSGIVLLVIILIAVGAAIAVTVAAWYPTTLEPQVSLTKVSVVPSGCVPFANGYAATYDWTFTLVNAGPVAAQAWVGLVLNGDTLGYQYYDVPAHSETDANAREFGSVHATAADCGLGDTPGLSLASVQRTSPIDQKGLLQATVFPIATLGFAGVLLGVLEILSRRRGRSLFRDMGTDAWAIGIFLMFAAGGFAGVVAQILMAPYNVPPSWAPAVIGATASALLGGAFFWMAARIVKRAGGRLSHG